jgi:chloramphenicol 3-O phosphotransferase
MEYDFELDTTHAPMPDLAQKLYDWHQRCQHPVAFDGLRQRFLS